LDLLAGLKQVMPVPQVRGLPPGSMRRVREHVEAHFGESIDLAELAAIAGLSVFHFARQFKQSAGITPHHYLVQRRVERAREMMARTDLSCPRSQLRQASQTKVISPAISARCLA
jgi:transcriptional regulator GlxA family with amidase domain